MLEIEEGRVVREEDLGYTYGYILGADGVMKIHVHMFCAYLLSTSDHRQYLSITRITKQAKSDAGLKSGVS
jgi:hypothetical protein